jgi:hypothetical protein
MINFNFQPGIFVIALSILLFQTIFAQGVGINSTGANPDPSAGLDVNFNDKGFLLPRMTSAQRDSILNPAEGLQIYNLTTKCFEAFYGVFWQRLHCGCSVAPSDLHYSDNGPLTYCVNQSIPLNLPSTQGGNPSSYTVTPVLPAGLFLNLSDGQISGTPLLGSTSAPYLVTASNACGSVTRTLDIEVVSAPNTPTAISGPGIPTFNTVATYSISAVLGATSYVWAVPSGWTINSGQGTTTINVTVGSNSDTISVTASNVCGVSAQSTKAVTFWRPIAATGGTITNYTANGSNGVNGVQYRVHSFSSVGSSFFDVTDAGTDGQVEYVIVGGGGGGGFDFGGGGGGGGYRASVIGELSGRNSVAEPLVVVSSQTYTVIVGGGGVGGFDNNQSTNGGNSSVFGIIALGGGGGANGSGARAYGPPKIGGCGGGGGGWFTNNQAGGAVGTPSQGFDGGAGIQPQSTSSPYGGGGGGGAGQQGQSSPNNNTAGKGGDGLPSMITGTLVYRSGGGGGGTYPSTANAGPGGIGGGANGASGINVNGQSALPNTGGGGGGNSGGGGVNTFGGNGGSGIVIIRYPLVNPNP